MSTVYNKIEIDDTYTVSPWALDGLSRRGYEPLFGLREFQLDFEKIVPPPVNMYRGPLDPQDKLDFPVNWLNWCRDNWGTAYNACHTHVHHDERRVFSISFETEETPPYPIMVALVNMYAGIKFQHKFFRNSEPCQLWGIDSWSREGRVRRFMHPDDAVPLARELFDFVEE